MSEAAKRRGERVVRILNLLSYLRWHPESTVMELARDLGSDPAQIREDLDVLYYSGVGRHGGQTIELEHDWLGVRVHNNQGLDRPLRLTPTEASALLLLLESLETMPGLVDGAAVASAAGKIRAVARGGVGDAQHSAQATTAATIRDALAAERQLELTYYSVSSDATTTRTVSPIDTFHKDGETYLRAWADGELRIFRFDRIKGISLIDAPSNPPTTPAHFDPADPFRLQERDVARLAIRRDAAWLADYWEITLEEAADGAAAARDWISATMHYGSADWLVRFCLSQADRVRLESPVELAEEVARRARHALRVLR